MSAVVSPQSRPWLSGPARVRWVLFFGIAAVVAIADQLSKAWVAANFQPASAHNVPGTAGGPTQVVGDWVRIAVSHNDGGIFGLAGSSALLLGLASMVVIGFIVVYQARQGTTAHPLLTVALGLLLGGAIGNLIDRLRLGYVIDWVDTGIGTTRWYTFNVADAGISIAIVLLILISLLGDRLDGATAPGDAARKGEAARTEEVAPL
jgi:signal peptidase II